MNFINNWFKLYKPKKSNNDLEPLDWDCKTLVDKEGNSSINWSNRWKVDCSGKVVGYTKANGINVRLGITIPYEDLNYKSPYEIERDFEVIENEQISSFIYANKKIVGVWKTTIKELV